MESLRVVLELMTDTQLATMQHKVWKKMTGGDGYQPFGYDSRTMNICHPVDFPVYREITEELRKRALALRTCYVGKTDSSDITAEESEIGRVCVKRKFKTEKEAVEFIDRKKDAKSGIWYIDKMEQ